MAKAADGLPSVHVAVVDSREVTTDTVEGLEFKSLPKTKWDAEQHRSGQQDTLIRAMIQVFAGLNGSVMLFVVAAWIGGMLGDKPPIITEHVVIALIGATVIQAGAAFILITRYLFPATTTASVSHNQPLPPPRSP